MLFRSKCFKFLVRLSSYLLLRISTPYSLRLREKKIFVCGLRSCLLKCDIACLQLNFPQPLLTELSFSLVSKVMAKVCSVAMAKEDVPSSCSNL